MKKLASALLTAGLVATSAAATVGCGGNVPGVAKDTFVAPVDVLQVKWRRHLTDEPLIEYKPQEFASAASDGARVFIGSSAKTLWAFSTRDGAIVWKQALGGAISGRPRYVAETRMVFVGADDGGMYAFDAETGARRWVYHTRGPIASQPVYADEALYFTTGENRVYALDARTGKWKWQYDREAPESFTIRGYPSPLVVKGRVYVGFSDGYLACLSAAGGDVQWARSLAGDATRFVDVDATPLYFKDTVYVSAYSTGVYALDPKDGSTKWRFDVEGATTVKGRGSRLYFTAAKSGLHAVDLEGHLLWRQALAAGGELSAPSVVGPYVLVSSAVGGTYVADAASGNLYQYFAPGHGVTSEPASDGQQVYVLSNGGYFYALALNQR
ncbi:MAG: Pyrrolo-quinoline quinone [Myxococcales bacterium]|nr:Pyrrolo-quinoline quinone [Myxococcales bacterium]